MKSGPSPREEDGACIVGLKLQGVHMYPTILLHPVAFALSLDDNAGLG